MEKKVTCRETALIQTVLAEGEGGVDPEEAEEVAHRDLVSRYTLIV